MWRKRKKRRPQLSRELAHALLEDAMARVQQPEGEAAEPAVPPPPPQQQLELPAPRTGESTRHAPFG
jgi:hypothetical protein